METEVREWLESACPGYRMFCEQEKKKTGGATITDEEIKELAERNVKAEVRFAREHNGKTYETFVTLEGGGADAACLEMAIYNIVHLEDYSASKESSA